jgi:hypothetical protein
MVSAQERTRLIEAYKDKGVSVAAVILKCAMGLLLIGGLAVIGV